MTEATGKATNKKREKHLSDRKRVKRDLMSDVEAHVVHGPIDPAIMPLLSCSQREPCSAVVSAFMEIMEKTPEIPFTVLDGTSFRRSRLYSCLGISLFYNT